MADTPTNQNNSDYNGFQSFAPSSSTYQAQPESPRDNYEEIKNDTLIEKGGKKPIAPSYQNQEFVSESYSNFGRVDQSELQVFHPQYKDLGFALFFIGYFIPANLLFLRYAFYISIKSAWLHSPIQWYRLFGAVISGIFWGCIWLYVILSNPHRFGVFEKYVTITSTTIVSVVMTFAFPSEEYLIHSLLLLWFLGIVRIAWDRLTEKDGNDSFTGEIIACIRPQVTPMYLSIAIILVVEIVLLGWWSLSFSFALVGTIDEKNYRIIFYPVIIVFLLLCGLWTIGVSRSLIQANVSGSIAGWYKSGGNNSPSLYRFSYLQNAMVHNFGTIVCSSLFIDVATIVSWFARIIHNLFWEKGQTSPFSTFEKRINRNSHYSFYSVMLHEDKSFTDSAEIIAPHLESGLATTLNYSTIQYHIIWIAFQSFVLNLVGFDNLISAILASFMTLVVLGAVSAAYSSFVTSFIRDPIFLQSFNPQLADIIQEKFGVNHKNL